MKFDLRKNSCFGWGYKQIEKDPVLMAVAKRLSPSELEQDRLYDGQGVETYISLETEIDTPWEWENLPFQDREKKMGEALQAALRHFFGENCDLDFWQADSCLHGYDYHPYVILAESAW